MKITSTMKVFIMSNTQEISDRVKEFLSQFNDFKVYFLPEYMSEFEVMKFEPDIIIKNQDVDHVINCRNLALVLA